VAANLSGHTVADETAKWLATIAEHNPKLHAKLAAVGLVASREARNPTTLAGWLTSYVESRIDVKPATKEIWSQVQRNLLDHFGGERDLSTINEGNAEDFKMYLIGEKLASTAVYKRLQFARMFFRAAKKRKLVAENPFAETMVSATASACSPRCSRPVLARRSSPLSQGGRLELSAGQKGVHEIGLRTDDRCSSPAAIADVHPAVRHIR